MNALFYVLLKNLEVNIMLNDPIVEEMRKYGQEYTARYNNDISAICRALNKIEHSHNQIVVNRPPKYIKRKAVS